MKEQVRMYITKEEIEKRVQELGKAIEADYGDKPLTMVCVLKGGVMFMADLCRAVQSTPVYFDFMDVSSYGNGTVSSGRVRILKDLEESPEGKDILLVEDVVDTGRTLTALRQLLLNRGANSVRICTFLDKPARRVVELTPDYVGITIPDAFVVGYWRDYAQRYRNLDYVGILELSEE